MTKRKLLIWIPVLAILLNGVVYLIVSNVRTPPKSVSTGTAAKVTGGAVPQENLGGTKEPDKARGNDRDDRDHAKEETATARRAAGLVALEAGDYDKAIIDFTEARALVGEKANVGELLRVSEELRTHPRATSAPRAATQAPSHVVVPRAPVRPPPSRRVATRDEPVVEANQVQAPPPPSGLLIVTTTPRGLLVHVDETAIDLTPMRTKVKPGSHRVALFDGDRKVYETTVDVKEGGTATLLKDLPSEGAAESPARATSPVVPAAPVTREESPRPVTAAAPTPAPPPPPPLTPPPSAAATDTGALQITSPGLYGVVWVNGRPRGYPPLEVSDLAGGPVKVEVRVNGIEKRALTVVVAPGRTTAVTLR